MLASAFSFSSSVQNHFNLLGLPTAFEIDLKDLESAWKKIATAVHPDRFATHTAAEKRVAMQWSSQANEAYRVLKDPLLRACYLCELAGVDLAVETNTSMPTDFLLRQMSWYEKLDSLTSSRSDPTSFHALKQTFMDELTHVEQGIKSAVSTHLCQSNYALAVERIREWMFLHKLIAQCRAVEQA